MRLSVHGCGAHMDVVHTHRQFIPYIELMQGTDTYWGTDVVHGDSFCSDVVRRKFTPVLMQGTDTYSHAEVVRRNLFAH
jgi:hypothetical protein